jgi:hypothetical protein
LKHPDEIGQFGQGTAHFAFSRSLRCAGCRLRSLARASGNIETLDPLKFHFIVF